MAAKRREIQALMAQWRSEIEAGEVTVFFVDECHLLWGDVCGYVWGPTNERVEIPIVNEKSKQTYFGALDYYTQEFFIQPAATANGNETVAFVQFLQARRPTQKIILVWDGASYHKGKEFQNYLETLNQGKAPLHWQVTCVLFAPNAPEQNPVEKIWLQAKNLVREFYFLCRCFQQVKQLFEFFTHGQLFCFPMLEQDGFVHG